MASSRKRKKHRWLRTLLIFVVTPLTVWLLAFLVWLFWHDIVGRLPQDKTSMRPGASSARDGELGKSRRRQPAKRSREDIREDDRKKLDDILQRQ